MVVACGAKHVDCSFEMAQNNYLVGCGSPNSVLHIVPDAQQDVPKMMVELFKKIFIWFMTSQPSHDSIQSFYGIIHTAVKQECFTPSQKKELMEFSGKIQKVFENVTAPSRHSEKRRYV